MILTERFSSNDTSQAILSQHMEWIAFRVWFGVDEMPDCLNKLMFKQTYCAALKRLQIRMPKHRLECEQNHVVDWIAMIQSRIHARCLFSNLLFNRLHEETLRRWFQTVSNFFVFYQKIFSNRNHFQDVHFLIFEALTCNESVHRQTDNFRNFKLKFNFGRKNEENL